MYRLEDMELLPLALSNDKIYQKSAPLMCDCDNCQGQIAICFCVECQHKMCDTHQQVGVYTGK